MLTRPQVQRFAAKSGLRDIMIAEKEIVLTYLLQLLAERGVLKLFAFKGGTCLRKMFLGSRGRFSTDLDFTSLEPHDHEDVILEMMQAFEEPFNGIQFSIPDGSYYEADDGVSWGVNPTYQHDWNSSGDSEIKIQISRSETPTLPTEVRTQCEQSYFKFSVKPVDIACLQFNELLAEKLRAGYQRNKARDVYDLAIFSTRPLNHDLIRPLVIIKLWQARDSFDPEKLLAKLTDKNAFDWADLAQLMRQGQPPNVEKMTRDCAVGYGFLAKLSADEKIMADDRHQRRKDVYEKIVNCLPRDG